MFEIIKALILGVIEGFTEFLPISSTGHLIVAEKVMNFHDKNELFTVVIQLGAIAAVIWYYRKDLFEKTVGLFKRQKEAFNFWLILAIGTIPAGLFGLLLDKSMQKLTIPFYVAVSLILGGIVLWFVDRKPAGERAPKTDLATISKKQAVLVGLGQAIAIFPGISRSGASIVTGLAVGLNRPTATAFSFYLSIPVMVLASGYKLIKYSDQVSQVTGGWPALIVGVIVAFITALFAIKWLLRYITRHNFRVFAIYRIALGFLILLLIATGVMI
jgi:undecaprenyl-diphosphatase